MRRSLFGVALLALCALPFVLRSVEARGARAQSTTDSPSRKPTVRTLARNVQALGLGADDSGRSYFTANDRVYRFTGDVHLAADGTAGPNAGLEIIAGTGKAGYVGDGGPASAAQFDFASSANGNLAADPAGNLFIADALNDTVRRVDSESQLISSIAGRWAASVSAEANAISKPSLVAADALGDVFVAGQNSLWRFDAHGGVVRIAAMIDPQALAVSRDGQTVAAAAGGGAMVIIYRSSDTASYAGRLAILAKADGGIANRVRKLGSEAQPFETGATTENADAMSDASSRPYDGLAIDSSGSIFVTDRATNSIYRLDARTFVLEAFAGTGHAGYSGDGGAPLAAEFNDPGALTLDHDGNLLIVDRVNRAIREITHAADPAGVTLSPNTFTFPNEPTGGASAPEAFTLTNNSAVQVTGITIAIEDTATPADFTETSTCATTLDPGASCAINVVFMPQAAGERSAALNVTDSDPSSPQTAALAGFADDYELQLQSGGTDTLTVIAGAEANYNLAIVPDDTFSGSVTINCPVSLPLDTTCQLTAGTATSSSGLPGAATGPTSMSFSVTPATPQNFYVTLITQAKNEALVAPKIRKWPQFPAARVLTFTFALLATLIIWRRMQGSGGNRYKVVEYAALVLAIILIVAGCGGKNTTTIIPVRNPGTPTGMTHLNVIANSQGATRAFTITLNVQD
jgi:hypothetical protein